MSRKKRNRRAVRHVAPGGDIVQPDDKSKLIRNLTLGAILTVTFAVFANSLGNGYAYDDRTQVLQNRVIRSFSNFGTALTKEVWFWRVLQSEDPGQEKPTTPYYRPMFTIFQMGCWFLFPATTDTGNPATDIAQNAAWWHLMNILIHLLVVYLTFLVLEKVTGDLRLSAIASLLFAIHPLRSESVAWICGVTDPFLAVFLLSSFLFYLRFRETGSIGNLIGSLGLFLLAAFSKEPAVALPLFIGAYELFVANPDKSFKDRIKPAIVFPAMFLVMSAFYFLMRYFALGFVLNDIKYTNYSPAQVLMTIPLVIWKYLGLLFWPVNLSIFHGTPMVESPLELRFILPALGLVALGLALWPFRKSLVARFAILWFGIHLLPVLNLSAFGEDFLVQERYVYTSSIGFSLLLAMAVVRIPFERWFSLKSRKLAQAVAVAAVVAILCGKSFAQNQIWKNDDELWPRSAEAAPDQTMALYIVGHHYLKKNRLAQCIDAFEQYMKLESSNPVVIANLSSAHLVFYESQVVSKQAADRTHVDRAIALCEQGLKLDARNAAFWDTLGRAYTYDTELKNYARARSCFNQALAVDPTLTVATLHLGFTYLKEGNFDTAISYFERARQQSPEFPDTYKNLGYAYEGKTMFQEAIDNLSLYLSMQPQALDAPKEKKHIEDLRAKLPTSSLKSETTPGPGLQK
jgi:tetratricopeptide (TPR) repeat protein